MEESLDGIFYIVRGQHKKKEPKFFNPASEDYSFIGGYNPEDKENLEWYLLMDNVMHRTHRTGKSFDFVLEGVKDLILKYKTRENFIAAMKRIPYKKSKIQHQTDLEVYKIYGDYFSDFIEEKENEARKILFGRKTVKPKVGKKIKPEKESKKESEDVYNKEGKISSGKKLRICKIKRK